MAFLAPLGLALSALAAPIILLYMLRLRRRDVQVSSTMLWQQLLRDREANTPWQRLRRNLLLFLQLLILAALVIALARPFIQVPTVTTGRIALLIDASASMNANDVSPNRFESAKQQALNVVDTLGSSDSMAVIRVAEGPEVVLNYSSNDIELRSAIAGLQPSESSADWNAALTLAAAGATGAEKFTILIVGDGGIPANVGTGYGEVKFLPVGNSDSNMAITALAPAAVPGGDAQLYARITNYGSTEAEVVFSLNLDDNLFSANNYTIPADSYQDVVVTIIDKDFRRIAAALTRPVASTVPDYLSLDDTAYAVYNPNSGGKALIVTRQNKFLEQGFESLPDWGYRTSLTDQSLPVEPFDLYVFDGYLPPTLPNSNMLIINPPITTPLFTLGEIKTDPGTMAVRPDDPRTRFLKFNDINMRQYRAVTGTQWADTLVSAANGDPLIVAGEYQGQRVAVINFDLHDSDLPLKIAWPILLSNLTEWYRAPRSLHINGDLHPGQTVTIQPGSQINTVRVTRPDGAISTYNVDQPLLVYADTPLAGIYTVDLYQGSDLVQTDHFAINVFDENESRLKPRVPTFGTTLIGPAHQDEIGQREFWPWVALAALLLLVLEWWAYHRRLAMPSLGNVALRRFARRH